MRRSRSALRIAIGGALAGAVGLVQGASGQARSEPTGLRLVVDYSLGLEVDTNERLRDPSPGTYSALVNGFDFALLSETRNQTFALAFGTELRLESDPEEEEGASQSDEGVFDLEAPRYNLEYTRESANSRLAVSAEFRRQDVDTVEPFFTDLDGDTIIDEVGFTESSGTLTDASARITLETGRNSRLGTTYTAAYQSRAYSETDDPDFFDRTEYRFATSTRLQFTDVSTGYLDLSHRNYEYSQGRDLIGESTSASFGLFHEFSETLTFDASLGYSKVREEETISDLTFIEKDQGPNAYVRLTRELPNGSVFGSYSRQLVEDTFRNTLTFGRDISLASYELRATVGLSSLDGGEPTPTFGIVYTRQFSDAEFSAALNRTVTVDTDDEERTLTSAVIAYDYEINELSSLSLGFDYALTSRPGESQVEDDQTQATFSATYSRALTRDWDMSVGYRARTRSSDTEDAFSNAVFVNVGRRFILRP